MNLEGAANTLAHILDQIDEPLDEDERPAIRDELLAFKRRLPWEPAFAELRRMAQETFDDLGRGIHQSVLNRMRERGKALAKYVETLSAVMSQAVEDTEALRLRYVSAVTAAARDAADAVRAVNPAIAANDLPAAGEKTEHSKRHDMPPNPRAVPAWLTEWMRVRKVTLWGAADLRSFSTPRDETGQGFPYALAWALPMDPHIMASIQNGPNQAYADEYAAVNRRLNELSAALAGELGARGHRAQPLAASQRTDAVNIKGDFPHKTAATRAGLGWIGRHCQLITRPFGSWVRLGTVFTDIELPCGPAVERSFCGRCTRCVAACPAQALTGRAWHPGLAREAILDAKTCDQWKKQHYFQYHGGHNCGICSAVCPYGLKVLKKRPTRCLEENLASAPHIAKVS